MKELGCFGLPSVHNPRSGFCRVCPDFDSCGQQARALIDKVARAPGMRELAHRFHYVLELPDCSAPPTLTPEQERRVASAPVKVAQRLRSLLERGFDTQAARSFATGTNPFSPTGAKHLHLAGELLLAGGFTRAQLRRRCETDFGWTPNTAASQVSQAVSLLRLLDLTEDQGDRVCLKTTGTIPA